MEPYGIIVFGANGSGKTTLGRELARLLHFKHMDHEDYHFEKSRIPYTVERSNSDCLKRMTADIEQYRAFVLSAVTGDFGDKIPSYYRLAVWLSARTAVRVERVTQRAREQYGERVRKGGDMYERHLDFVNFVAARPLSAIEQWAQTLTCPVIRVDGEGDWRANAVAIAKQAGLPGALLREVAEYNKKALPNGMS